MNFIISASTDIGITKNTNQDSYDVKVLSTTARENGICSFV